MMLALFTMYLLAILTMFSRKRKWAMTALWAGLLLSGFLLWFHATDKIGINL